MFNYKIVGCDKIGNRNIYTLRALNYSVNNKMAGTTEVKELALKDQISNALWKSKLVEIPDRLEALVKLQEVLKGTDRIKVENTYTSRDKQRRHIMFFNLRGRDITCDIWNVLSNICDYSEKTGLIVSGCGMDMVQYVIKQLRDIAKNNGMVLDIKGYDNAVDKNDVDENTFVYGCYHFKPIGFLPEGYSFVKTSKYCRQDLELGVFEQGQGYGDKKPTVDYTMGDFYKAGGKKARKYDIFQCLENGEYYIPTTYRLDKYVGEFIRK